MIQIELTQSERQSFLWKKLQEKFEEMLATERAKNDKRLDADETARTRGRISILKELIAVNAEAPKEEDEE